MDSTRLRDQKTPVYILSSKVIDGRKGPSVLRKSKVLYFKQHRLIFKYQNAKCFQCFLHVFVAIYRIQIADLKNIMQLLHFLLRKVARG